MNLKLIWFVPAIVVALGIFLLSTFLSIPVRVEGIGYLDKIEHAFAYFVLMSSFMFAFKKTEILTTKRSYYLLVGASAYGFLLELAQYTFFPNRYFEWVDAMANVLGVIIGYLIFKLIFRG